jgi:hypothetical protein
LFFILQTPDNGPHFQIISFPNFQIMVTAKYKKTGDLTPVL